MNTSPFLMHFVASSLFHLYLAISIIGAQTKGENRLYMMEEQAKNNIYRQADAEVEIMVAVEFLFVLLFTSFIFILCSSLPKRNLYPADYKVSGLAKFGLVDETYAGFLPINHHTK